MPSAPRRQVFIGNLHYRATEADIRAAFDALGVQVHLVRVIVAQDTQQPKGFAFVDLHHDEPRSVEEVITLLNGYEFLGRKCRTGHAHTRPPRTDSPAHVTDADDYEWK